MVLFLTSSICCALDSKWSKNSKRYIVGTSVKKIRNEKNPIKMKKLYMSLLIVASFVLPGAAQLRYKTVDIPDITGYKTLKCDFHIHTIYSDGNVTPDVRVLEAVSEGLDALAFTDHVYGKP